MLRYTLFILFFICAFKVKAQNIVVTGRVIDTLRSPIAYANVLAADPKTGAVTSFAVTDTEGRFKLSLSRNTRYLLKVSFIGYATFEETLNCENADIENLLIELSQSTSYLDAVEVVEEMPVTMSGDTLIYKTDAFTSGRERKLGDVLEKLPGIEVDDNGEVKVQGKKVNKVLVDGKQFFDGDTKMATKNLPANAIERVQVLKNYNEVSPMNGLANDDKLALNIQLKEGKKNLVFGDVSIGGGLEGRYAGHGNIFYYSPKVNVNFIGDANNIGEQPFTMQDYFRFSGGLGEIDAHSGSDVNISSDDLGFPMANRETAQELQTKLGALNFNYNPSKKWHHSAFFIGSGSKSNFGSLSQRRYLREDLTSQELLQTDLSTTNHSGLLKYSATYTPKEQTYIKYSLFGKAAGQTSANSQWSQFPEQSSVINEKAEQNPLSLDQQLEWYHTPDEKNVFSWEAKYSYQSKDPFLKLSGDQSLFPSFLKADVRSLEQSRNISSQRAVTAFNYYRVLNKTNHINFSLGYQYLEQDYASGIYQDQESGVPTQLDSATFLIDANYHFSDFFAGLTYKMKYGPLILSPSLYLHKYQVNNRQGNMDITNEPVLVLPSMYAKWDIRSTQSLTFRYSMNAEFADIEKQVSGLIISDYNALYQGNPLLNYGLYHMFSLYYNYFNLFGGMNMFGNVSYRRKTDGFATTSNFSELQLINSVYNAGKVNENFSGMLQADKRFNQFKISGAAEVTASTVNNEVDGGLMKNNSIYQTYKASLTTTLWKQLDVKIGYKYQLNSYKSTVANNSFATYNPYVRLGFDITKSVNINTEYSYNTYKNTDTQATSKFMLWDAALRIHKPSSPWEFDLTGYNLLNTLGVQRNSFNANLISTYEYYIQQRYIVLSVKYDL
ncbi:carboxypeptidase-like regulatory domain-containing protein [Fulvivirga maritima]|uniref:TonB-dependent receptor n=1 Tax=Fulvivirga maritima TaxID=2904247 RepID=UPI001F397FE5|nr:TonB-dependent receptor [Fulvivirga maritima]UII27905.1 carboxypeptidase-like regulatory domain-containing protein [Fulvivirga maritima]